VTLRVRKRREQLDASRRTLFSGARGLLQAAAVGVVLLLLALLVWDLVRRSEGAQLVTAVGKDERPQAPGFELPVVWPHTETWPRPLRAAVADGTVVLVELRGYPVVVNFWASWCVPCKREARAFAASAHRHNGEVVFVGVNVQDLTSTARRFLDRYDVPYVSARDAGDSTYSAYGLTGLPETYYLDWRGRIVAHDVGEVSSGGLQRMIARILPK
jgi:cytochrome c biogenesis protein CcmG/thiol:disulfide interchange protein DsbE